MSRVSLSIGEVAKSSGLRPSALRFYEDQKLIKPVARDGGRRRFDKAVLGRLSIIAFCQGAGFTIREISQFLAGNRRARDQWRELATGKLVELDSRIEQAKATKKLLEAAIACDCADPANCEMLRGAQG